MGGIVVCPIHLDIEAGVDDGDIDCFVAITFLELCSDALFSEKEIQG
jgi:hypothetical protein